MNKAYLILIYVFSPILYFSVYFIAFGSTGLTYAYGNFINVWPYWVAAWGFLLIVVIVYWRTPSKPFVITRYRMRSYR
jgi:hypothetical protein